MKKVIFCLIFMNLVSAFAQVVAIQLVIPSGLTGLKVGPDVYPLEKGVLRPFRSDACSLSPSSIPGTHVNWATCCVQHDRAYWLGGTEKDRLTADEKLKSCISEKASSFLAMIYFSAVRLGGRPATSTAFRWGYGWSYIRPYSPLTNVERLQAQALYGPKLEGLAAATDLKIIASNSKFKVIDQTVQPIQSGELEIYKFLKSNLGGSTSILSASYFDISFEMRQFRLVLESCPQSEVIFEVDRSSSEIKRIIDEHACLSKVGQRVEEKPHTLAF